MTKKIEMQYDQLGKSINNAIGQKDMQMFEEFLG
jgi:hypothetical protein